MKTVLIISGILGALANIPYIIAILRTRNTSNPMKPQRVSWFLWALLDVLILLTSLTNGATLYEVALPLGYTIGAVVIALLAISYGEWGDLKQARLVFIGSLIGIVIWLITDAGIALYAFVTVLWLSAFPTIRKIWNDPKSESRLPWTMWFIAASLSLIALGNPSTWTFLGSVVTLTYFLMNVPITFSMFFRE